MEREMERDEMQRDELQRDERDRGDEALSTRDIAASRTSADLDAEPPGAPEPAMAQTPASDTGPLLQDADQSDFQSRWAEIQTTFVDDPQRAVSEADVLVAAVMKRLADGFAEERERLEGVWGRGEDVGTEDLRLVLQRYRAFFHRLLAT
jgi:hypothetical protein